MAEADREDSASIRVSDHEDTNVTQQTEKHATFLADRIHITDVKGVKLSDLPDSVLLHIFSFVPLDLSICALAATCLRFRVLADDFTLWKRNTVRFSADVAQTSLNKLKFFSAKILQGVDLGGNEKINDRGFLQLLTGFRGIRDLNLSGCKALTSLSLGCLATYPPVIRSLNLNGCYWFCPDMVLAVVTHHGPALRHLDLGGSNRLTRDVTRVSRMAEACCRLKSLVLGWTQHPIDQSSNVSPIIDTDVRKFARQCGNLTYLRLTRCHIGDDSIAAIASTCHHLVMLDLSLTYISNNAMAIIGKYFSRLENLVLSGCWKISDSGLLALAEHRPQLRELNLRRCVDVTAQCLAHFLTIVSGLRELDLSKCFQVNDSVIDSIELHCHRLGVLHIAGTSITRRRVRELQRKWTFPIALWDARRLRK